MSQVRFTHKDGTTSIVAGEVGEELARLREIVSCLPTTADGVPIHKPMTLYAPPHYYGKVVEYYVQAFSPIAEGRDAAFGGVLRVSKLYSTRQAAEAAMKGKQP